METENQSSQMEASWASAFSQARREATAGVRKTRETPKKNEAITPEIKQLQEITDKLMEPAYWKALVRAPGDYMLATTGHAHWNISEKETETLAVTGSLVAKAWLMIDPRYLALILFLSNASFIYGTRFLTEMRLVKQDAMDKLEKREPKP